MMGFIPADYSFIRRPCTWATMHGPALKLGVGETGGLIDNGPGIMFNFMIKMMKLIIFPLVVMLFLLDGGMVQAEEKITIGLVEDVILLPWGVRVPARIDTGAATSSLDARHLTIKDNMAEFRLPKKAGGLKLRLPVIKWEYVRSAEARERRPVVEIEFCLGPKRMRTQVNLNDRSRVKYPLIIGRNVLQGNYVVDCMKEHCQPPSCPEAASK